MAQELHCRRRGAAHGGGAAGRVGGGWGVVGSGVWRVVGDGEC